MSATDLNSRIMLTMCRLHHLTTNFMAMALCLGYSIETSDLRSFSPDDSPVKDQLDGNRAMAAFVGLPWRVLSKDIDVTWLNGRNTGGAKGKASNGISNESLGLAVAVSASVASA